MKSRVIMLVILCIALVDIGCVKKSRNVDRTSPTPEPTSISMSNSLVEKMPEVVFCYLVETSGQGKEGTFYVINQEGIIYSGVNKEFVAADKSQINQQFEKIKTEKDTKVIGQIDKTILQEKYKILQDIVQGSKYNMTTEESLVDVYLGRQYYNGYYCDATGTINVVTLSGEGDVVVTVEDTRAMELVNWLKKQFL